MSELPDDFWLPPGIARQHKKAAAPKTGPAFGHWSGRDLKTLQLPGGGLLSYDLNKLTLADYRSMRDHYQVNASLTVLQFMMHRMDWHIECKDKQIAEFIEWNIREVWTRLIRAVSQAYWAGHSPSALEWVNDPYARDGKGALVLDKVKDLIPEECKVEWLEVEGWAPPDRIPPKFKIYNGIRQQGIQWPIPPENTLWYPLLMENGDYRGKKLLRSAFSSWYFSILVHLYANRYYERFGEPVPVGRAPYDDDVVIDGESVNGRDAMERILMSLRNRSVVVLPDDRNQLGDNKYEYAYDIEYLESQMRGGDFESYLMRLDEEITLGLFTPLLLLRGGSSGTGGAGYNIGVQQMQTYLWMLNALAGDLKEYLDKFIIDRLRVFNFNANSPKAYWVYRGMGKENIETIRGIVVELVKGGRVNFDYQELGQAVGLSLEEVDLLTEPQGDPEAPPTDDRDKTGRPRDDRKRSRGVGSPRATGRSIAARIQGTVDNIFRKENFREAPRIRMGYRRAMLDEIADELGYDRAEPRVETLYTTMNVWLADALDMSPTTYKTADDFMNAFASMFDSAFERATRA